MSFEPRSVRKRGATGDEWVFLYEWFAGWRWERYRDDRLHEETLDSYETFGQCVASASARGYRSRRGLVHYAGQRTVRCIQTG